MANAKLKKLVDQLPAPDNRGMLTTDIDKDKIEKLVAEIAKGGKANVLGLIEMLGEPGSVENAKPHFALHCIINYPLITDNEQLRKDFCSAVASQIANEKLSNYNRAYLCQELQWAGRDEACPALGKALLHEHLTDAAATALAAIGGQRAASQLLTAVTKTEGKCRLNIIDALATLAEPKSATTFKEMLKDKDREVRIAASVGLANVGQASAAKALLDAAAAAEGWERTQITKACLVLAENLAAVGKKSDARRIYESLKKSRSDKTEQHIKHAAELGLAALA